MCLGLVCMFVTRDFSLNELVISSDAILFPRLVCCGCEWGFFNFYQLMLILFFFCTMFFRNSFIHIHIYIINILKFCSDWYYDRCLLRYLFNRTEQRWRTGSDRNLFRFNFKTPVQNVFLLFILNKNHVYLCICFSKYFDLIICFFFLPLYLAFFNENLLRFFFPVSFLWQYYVFP